MERSQVLVELVADVISSKSVKGFDRLNETQNRKKKLNVGVAIEHRNRKSNGHLPRRCEDGPKITVPIFG